MRTISGSASRKRSVAIATGATVLVIAAFWMWWNGSIPFASATQEKTIDRISAGDHRFGDPNAPIELVVYTDFSCPYCKYLHTRTFFQLRGEFGNIFEIAYRHFPLLHRHADARTKALASECAAAQEGESGYWRFVEILFHLDDVERTMSTSSIVALASANGFEESQMRECVEGEFYAERVDRERGDAVAAGMNTSPTVVVMDDSGMITLSGSWYSPIASAVRLLLKN